MSTDSPHPPTSEVIRRRVREPMQPAAITGGVLIVLGSAVVLLSTLVIPWVNVTHRTFKDRDPFGNAIYRTQTEGATLPEIWETRREFVPSGLLFYLTAIAFIISLTYFLYRWQHLRRIWAIIGLVIAIVILVLAIWTILRLGPAREGGYLALLAALLMIGGGIAATAANSGPAVPATVPAAPRQPETELTRQLRELASLRDQGVLTDDEFQATKQQLLGLD